MEHNKAHILNEDVLEVLAKEVKTLKERIEINTIDLYNYNKHDGCKSKGRSTGTALLVNKVTNLSIIDIDINKSLDDEQKDKIRNNILSKLSDDDVIVKTASGGLRIYCNTNDFYINNNRLIKCYRSDEYDIDLFSCYDESKRSLVVMAGSKYRDSSHKTPITKYEYIRNDDNSIITRCINDVLNDLDVKLTISQPTEIQQLMDLSNDDNITIEFANILIHGLDGIEVHNDGGNMPLTKEVTLFTLFQAINSLPNDVINYAYDYVYNSCNLTPNAKANYHNAMNRYINLKTHYGVLIKIIKLYNNDYYKQYIKSDADEIIISDIDLNDAFTMTDISYKAENHKYRCFKDIVQDLSKVIRYIESNNLMFIIKTYNVHSNKYVISYMTNTNMKELLKMIKLWKDDRKHITAYDAFIAHKSKLTIKGVKFNSNDNNIFSVFQGYKYNTVDEVDINLISNYLSLIMEVIADNNNDVYNYILNWISYIVQNPGVKTETALILKGLQGIGKGTFTDILSELLSGYSVNNVTEISELTGNFNSVIEDKMLLVLNELKNVGDDRLANFNSLKSIITDKTIRINEKNQPRRTSENVANFIFVTNNSYPVKIESGDRRYVVLSCNGKYKNNHTYWSEFYKCITDEFYSHLLTYFMNRDINEFNPRDIPMTEAKEDLIEASRSLIDIFICDNYDKLCEGWLCSEAILFKPYDMKERTFCLQLKDKCIRKQRKIDGKPVWHYFLKDECKSLYKQTITDDDI